MKKALVVFGVIVLAALAVYRYSEYYSQLGNITAELITAFVHGLKGALIGVLKIAIVIGGLVAPALITHYVFKKSNGCVWGIFFAVAFLVIYMAAVFWYWEKIGFPYTKELAFIILLLAVGQVAIVLVNKVGKHEKPK